MKKELLTLSLLLLSAFSFAQIQPVQPVKPVDPVKPVQKTGTVSISSNPSECYVKINDESIGKTPLTIKKASGKYVIIVEKEGYETYSQTINVVAGQTVKVKSVLPEKKLTPKDSLLLLADELLAMKSYYVEDFVLNEEGKNIVSFQKNSAKYVRNIKDIYLSSVSKEKGGSLSDEELKANITNNVLRMQNNSKLESSCLKEAMTIVKNLQPTESNVKVSIQFVYGTLLQLSAVSQEQPLDQEKTNKIVELIGQVKLADAAGIIDDSLLEEKVIKRYSLFFKFLKDFYNAGNMRLEELKSEAN